MEKFKKVLKVIYKVYSIFCAVVTTLLLIAAITVWVNFGRITGKAIEIVVDNFNTEINSAIQSQINSAIPDGSVRFNSIKTIKGGGLQADFTVNTSVITMEEIAGYAEKTNEELLAEFGITAADIPREILPILSTVKQSFVLDFKDSKGNPVLSREITVNEIMKLLES